jgi:hypothetical protein
MDEPKVELKVAPASPAATAARPKARKKTGPGEWKRTRMIAAAVVRPVLLAEEQHTQTGETRTVIDNDSAQKQNFVAPLGAHYALGIDVMQYLTMFFLPLDTRLAKERVDGLNAQLQRLHFYIGQDLLGKPSLRCQVVGDDADGAERLPTLLEGDPVLGGDPTPKAGTPEAKPAAEEEEPLKVDAVFGQ